MKIELSNGHVIMSDYVTKKAAREYDRVLFEDANFSKNDFGESKDAEEIEEKASSKLKFNPHQISMAAEALAYNLVVGIVQVTEDGSEKNIEKTQDWWDNLREEDAAKIENSALELKGYGQKKVAKS